MLRNLAIALGVICFGGGLIALLADAWPGALISLILGALLLLGTVWERVHYKPLEVVKPGAGFVATDECFVDDETGKLVRVYLEPTTGERRYVRECPRYR
jgi:hypothetical protein